MEPYNSSDDRLEQHLVDRLALVLADFYRSTHEQFMLLTLSTQLSPATDLGYLLAKHPDRCQSFDLSFGQAHVFYPEVTADRATVCLLLDVDGVELVRGKQRDQSFALGQYVNDRPYVASSLLSVAISQVFGSALAGRCKERPELATQPLPITARIDVLPVRGDAQLIERLFAPLGYQVESQSHALDDHFPAWGESCYYSVSLHGQQTLADLLTHLYVLIPVFDNEKHYYVDNAELEKLLSKGASWLAAHPEKELITRRYLQHRPTLYRQALDRLAAVDETNAQEEEPIVNDLKENKLEQTLSLNTQRHQAVVNALLVSGAHSVVDLGCGEGKLLRRLLQERQFTRIVGLDVSIRSLEIARARLKLDRLAPSQAERLELLHGSLIYRDQRLTGFDAAALVEVIEHLDPSRLASLERVVFEFARPQTVVVTTPNREYNALWPSLSAGEFRHADHRFEWDRSQFQNWAHRIAERYGYSAQFQAIGDEDPVHGPPTQMSLFRRS